MKILITGSRGYIGARLCKLLAQQAQHAVWRGTRHAQNDDQVQMDWSTVHSLEAACVGVDAVVHLAALNAAECVANPALAPEVNGVQTVRLLQAARRQGVKRFIYLSTAHVYGDMRGRLNEESPLRSSHPYATSHRAAEDAVMTAVAESDMSCVVLRLSNAYGRPIRPDTDCWMLLMNNLCRQASTTGIMRLNGNGMQRRDFITMNDACRAIVHVLEMPMQERNHAIYNLGGGWSPTVLEVAEWIGKRYQALYMVAPELVRPLITGEPAPSLDYDCTKLARTGFLASRDRESELNALLVYCHMHFSRTE